MRLQEYLEVIKKVYDEVISNYDSLQKIDDSLFKEIVILLLSSKDDSYENIYEKTIQNYMKAVSAISKLSPGFSAGLRDIKNDIVLNVYTGKKSDTINADLIDENSVFDVSSMTKLFTSILLLHEEKLGHIDLNKTFAYYNPFLKNLDIPIRNALKFGFNINTLGRIDENEISDDERLKRLFSAHVKDDNTFIYSDIPYMLVPLLFGETIEKATYNYLKKFYTFYRKELGLQNTGYSFINAAGGTIVSKYDSVFNKFEYMDNGLYDPKANIFEGRLGYISGHAGVTTNVLDLEKLFGFLSNGLLSEDSLTDLVTSVRPGEKILLNEESNPILRNDKYININRGMGVYINLGDIRICDISSRCSVNAFAAEGSTGTYTFYDLANGFNACYLSNIRSGIYSKKIYTDDYVYGDDNDAMPKYYETTLISGTGTMKDGSMLRPDGTYMPYVRATNNFKEECLTTLLKLRITKNVLTERAKLMFEGRELINELNKIDEVFNGKKKNYAKKR